MIPFGKETVTLVHRIERIVQGRTQVSYRSETLTGCSWQWSNQWIRVGEVLTPVGSLVCRIPADQTKPLPGDLLIHAQVTVTITSGADYNALVEHYRDSVGAMVVGSVADNAQAGCPLPHWAARS